MVELSDPHIPGLSPLRLSITDIQLNKGKSASDSFVLEWLEEKSLPSKFRDRTKAEFNSKPKYSVNSAKLDADEKDKPPASHNVGSGGFLFQRT
jgi:hypothetical protein